MVTEEHNDGALCLFAKLSKKKASTLNVEAFLKIGDDILSQE
jgi:hypothetical protein